MVLTAASLKRKSHFRRRSGGGNIGGSQRAILGGVADPPRAFTKVKSAGGVFRECSSVTSAAAIKSGRLQMTRWGHSRHINGSPLPSFIGDRRYTVTAERQYRTGLAFRNRAPCATVGFVSNMRRCVFFHFHRESETASFLRG